jgi:hypothetical protein
MSQPITKQYQFAFAGPKLSGKSTAVAYLSKKIQVKEVSFAQPLKDVTGILFDIPMENMQDSKLKEVVLEEYGVTPREILIALGDCLRFDLQKRLPNLKLKRNVLTDKGQRTIKKLKALNENIAVSDLRDPVTEQDMLKEEGFTIVNIQRPEEQRPGMKITHWTENGIPNPDVTLLNLGTADFYKEIDTLLNNTPNS